MQILGYVGSSGIGAGVLFSDLFQTLSARYGALVAFSCVFLGRPRIVEREREKRMCVCMYTCIHAYATCIEGVDLADQRQNQLPQEVGIRNSIMAHAFETGHRGVE